MPCDKLKLKEFTGSGASQGEIWFKKFELASQINEWKDEDCLLQLPYHLSGAAASWYGSLDAATKGNWPKLKKAFESFFLQKEPAIVTEQKLMARKLQPGESLEDYLADIVELGARVGRDSSSLSSIFLNGLPTSSMKDYCLTSDRHDLTSYMNRARIWLARHPQTGVKFDSSIFYTEEDARGAMAQQIGNQEVINAITEGFKGLRADLSQRGRSEYRGKGRGRNNNRQKYRSKSPQRNRSKSPRDSRSRDSRSPSREKQGNKVECWNCGGENHYARHCTKPKN